jgi:hypothetical protein
MSARLKEVQRKAELDVKAITLKRKAALAEAKLRLDLDAEKLELEEQMAISAARCKALDNFEDEQSNVSAKLQKPSVVEQAPVLSPFADSFVPAHHHATHDLKCISNTEEIMMSVVKHLPKPQVDITKFSGDPLKYKRFIRQFQTRIVNNTDDDDEKMTFLD